MIFMKRALGECHKFHMKWPRVLGPVYHMPFKIGFYRLYNGHNRQYFKKKTHFFWHGRCQWRYVYAPKYYYTCGHTIFMTRRYPLNTSDVIRWIDTYIKCSSVLLNCIWSKTMLDVACNATSSRASRSTDNNYLLRIRIIEESLAWLIYISSYDVAVMQWITSCHKNRMTTRVMTLWRVHVASLTASVSTIRFLVGIIFILKPIKSPLWKRVIW